MPLLVEQLRGGGLVETVHPIIAAVADATGVRASFGGTFACFWRSSSKPMQLVTSLEQLDPALVAALPREALAVGAASHGATPLHTERVASLLTTLGCTEHGLRCGAHWPGDEESARALARAGGEPTALHNNCSGKHAFMLAATLARGWDPDYRPADHPLQRLNAARMAEWCGTPAPASAIDGCGIPTFHHPVDSMARGFARLAAEMSASNMGSLAHRVGWAMHLAPAMTSSPGELDALLATAATEPVTAKRGAEGLLCLALPNRGLGIAVKALTGVSTALGPAVRAVLDEVAPGVLPADLVLPGEEVRNVVGARVGERRAVWS